MDAQGNLYIGDFGDFRGFRRASLCHYVYRKGHQHDGSNTVHGIYVRIRVIGICFWSFTCLGIGGPRQICRLELADSE